MPLKRARLKNGICRYKKWHMSYIKMAYAIYKNGICLILYKNVICFRWKWHMPYIKMAYAVYIEISEYLRVSGVLFEFLSSIMKISSPPSLLLWIGNSASRSWPRETNGSSRLLTPRRLRVFPSQSGTHDAKKSSLLPFNQRVRPCDFTKERYAYAYCSFTYQRLYCKRGQCSEARHHSRYHQWT